MPQALVVDDSRTARAVLKRMLSKEGYEVEAAESAEQAFDILQAGDTDVVFMDHMMPGMDGFSAVKHIKTEQQFKNIPIVMYTSKEGQVYIGQARALGAFDVLNKPVEPAELRRMLAKVEAHLHDIKINTVSTEFDRPANETKAIGTFFSAANGNREESDVEPVSSDTVAIQRFKGHAANNSDNELAREPQGRLAAGRFQTEGRFKQSYLLFALALLSSVLVFKQYWSNKDLNTALSQQQRLLDSIEWTSNQAGQYGFGEKPLAGRRVELLRQLLDVASELGLEGTITLRAHTGQFCMSQSKSRLRGLLVAADALAIGECAQVGESSRAARDRSSESSRSFDALLEQHASIRTKRVVVKIESLGSSAPVFQYPAASKIRYAGDWNKFARKNNRVEFDVELQPR